VPGKRRIESVFLNIPYDDSFENLYLAYIVGLTQLGLAINAALAVPNQGRLATIIELIDKSDFSIHDLSRVEVSRGLPRFNMPVELGLALYPSHITNGQHRVFIFERKQYRAQRSTSDVNGIDPQIHNGTAQRAHGWTPEYLPSTSGCDNGSGDARQLSSRETENSGDEAECREQISFRGGNLSGPQACVAG
jgi:hypothetical protein